MPIGKDIREDPAVREGNISVLPVSQLREYNLLKDVLIAADSLSGSSLPVRAIQELGEIGVREKLTQVLERLNCHCAINLFREVL